VKRRPANFQCLFDLAPAAAHTIPRIIFHNNRRYYSRGRLSSRPRGFALLFLFLLPLFSLLSSAPVARAACFNPAGVAGDTIYNAAYRVMQYCNGGAWAGIGHVSNLTGGLVGWWKLDDGAGTSAGDSSGNGNTGTLTGSPLPAWTTSGMNNGALNFAGGATTNYVGVPSNSVLSGMATLTVAAWIYVDGTATGGSVIDKRHTGTPDWNSYYVVIDLTNFRYGPTVTNASGTASTFTASAVGSLVLNTWQHVVMVYDGANVQMYINGAASGAPGSLTGAVMSSSVELAIGNMPYNLGFGGKIDDVRIYNRALSAADIMTLYTSTGGASGDINSNLAGYWKLDDANGNLAADSTGNGSLCSSSSSGGSSPSASASFIPIATLPGILPT
jgi:hypothetical protein